MRKNSGSARRTLFLDEIGEMPLSLQPSCSAFWSRKSCSAGQRGSGAVDARVVSATNGIFVAGPRGSSAKIVLSALRFPIDIHFARPIGDIIHWPRTSLKNLPAPAAPQVSLAAELAQELSWVAYTGAAKRDRTRLDPLRKPGVIRPDTFCLRTRARHFG